MTRAVSLLVEISIFGTQGKVSPPVVWKVEMPGVLRTTCSVVAELGRLVPVAGGGHLPMRGAVVLVGRSASRCQLPLDQPEISRVHCRVWVEAGAVHIEDLASTNGTWVNGVRVERATLSAADVIHLGTIGYWFEPTLCAATVPM